MCSASALLPVELSANRVKMFSLSVHPCVAIELSALVQFAVRDSPSLAGTQNPWWLMRGQTLSAFAQKDTRHR